MKKSKAAIITTSRADYGILFPLIEKMKADKFFDVRLIVTGSHLSEMHGNTIEHIRNDGIHDFDIIKPDKRSDGYKEICQSISEGIYSYTEIFSQNTYDYIIVLGDRYELWPACITAVIHRIPIVHIHGGETTIGAIDECIRHSVTKMAALHFPSIPQYAKRIIQMGENPERVHVVGALGIDNIRSIELMEIEEISNLTGVDFNRGVALMTYHPVTMESYDTGAEQVEIILKTLLESNVFTVITAPNADAGNRIIMDKINSYVDKYCNNFKYIKNLGQKAYLSVLKYARFMIGNSSSGIIESASFKLPVINIGDRQAGRYKPNNVIDCECKRETISMSVKQALSKEFADSIANLQNPYGDGYTANRIIQVLKQIDFINKDILLKKKFYDVDFDSGI